MCNKNLTAIAMRTTATQFGILFGIVTGLGQILAGNPLSVALRTGLLTGCLILLALFVGDWIVDRLFGTLDRHPKPSYESVSIEPDHDHDDSSSDTAIAA